MSTLKTVVIVSSDPSDIYFANQLIKKVNVVGVFVEKQYAARSSSSRLKMLLQLSKSPVTLAKKLSEIVIQKHYARKAERIAFDAFGEDGNRIEPTATCDITYIDAPSTINTAQYTDAVRAINPDIIAVCGASILKESILTIPPKGVLNLHGGLSQKYRGVWTTLWAIYNEEPEYVGFTVHFVSPGIDTGEIIYQDRPDMDEQDNHETLYTKIVTLGTKALIRAIGDIENNRAKSFPLKQKGDLYLSADVTPSVIKQTWAKVNAGVIKKYTKSPKELRPIGDSKQPESNAS